MKSNLLIGRDAICSAFGLSVDQFYTFCAMGMPVSKINNRLYGHREQIDLFFRQVTQGETITVDERKARHMIGDAS